MHSADLSLEYVGNGSVSRSDLRLVKAARAGSEARSRSSPACDSHTQLSMDEAPHTSDSRQKSQISIPETRTTMRELQPSLGDRRESTREPMNPFSLSVPERYLLEFIHSVKSVIGTDMDGLLTELWLDELTSMDRTPGPTGPEWRLVTLGASARLARRLLECIANKL